MLECVKSRRKEWLLNKLEKIAGQKRPVFCKAALILSAELLGLCDDRKEQRKVLKQLCSLFKPRKD